MRTTLLTPLVNVVDAALGVVLAAVVITCKEQGRKSRKDNLNLLVSILSMKPVVCDFGKFKLNLFLSVCLGHLFVNTAVLSELLSEGSRNFTWRNLISLTANFST